MGIEKIIMKISMILAIILLLMGFTRADYGSWIDIDKDCQDTRQEVLIRQSKITPSLDKKGCKVISGYWDDLYSGETFTNPKQLDIDHFVPLAEVDRSGGDKWSKEKKQAYANDLKNKETLIAVSLKQNRSKGDKDPADWLPANKEYHCEYVKRWLIIKQEWGLSIDDRERIAIDNILENCPALGH